MTWNRFIALLGYLLIFNVFTLLVVALAIFVDSFRVRRFQREIAERTLARAIASGLGRHTDEAS